MHVDEEEWRLVVKFFVGFMVAISLLMIGATVYLWTNEFQDYFNLFLGLGNISFALALWEDL